MALVVIRCPCGCVFHRHESAEKICPSCGAYHDPGRGLSPSTLRSLLVLSSSVLAGLLLVLLALLLRKETPPPRPPSPPAATDPPAPLRPAPPSVEPPKAVALPPPPKPQPLEELQGAEVARAYRLAARGNLGNLVNAVLIHTHAGEAAAHLRAALRAEHEELIELLRLHPRRVEFRALPQRIEPDDEILAFSTVGLDPRRPGPFVDEIKAWFRTLHPGAATLVTVRRGSSPRIIPIYAPTLQEDIASLIRLIGVAPGGGGAGDVQVRRPLSASLLAEVARRLQQLHPSQRDSLPDELSSRAADLLRFAVGNEEDEVFLRVRLLDLSVRPLEEEYARLLKTSADLEARAFSAVRPDILVFKTGRRLNVRLLEESPERVRVLLHVGEARFLRDELASIERGQAAVAELQPAYAAARNEVRKLLELLPRVRDPRLKPLRELVCARILALDPVHDLAWSELGFAPAQPTSSLRNRDVVHLKDGSRRSGLLVEEGPAGVQLEVAVRGPLGDVIGLSRLRWQQAELAGIDRMSEPAREELRARASVREGARQRLEAELARVPLSPADVRGRSTSGTHVDLLSTASERSTRETAQLLEVAFTAFHREFDIRQIPERRLQVQLLSDRPSTARPAAFDSKEALLVSYDPAGSAEALAFLEEIRGADQDIERQLQSLKEEEARHEEQRRSLRRSLEEETAARRRNERPEAVEAWKERRSAALRQAEQDLDEQFARYRREARRGIEARQEASVRGQAALSTLGGAFRAALLREAFHAFAERCLWSGLDAERLPPWLRHGFAAYFETAMPAAGELRHGAPHARHLALLSGRALPPAAALLRAGPGDFAAELPRAHAWLIAHWMLSRDLHREALERYAKATAGGADPAQALEAAAGLAGPALDAALRLHLDRLPGRR